jgi:hypothetical protein
MIAKFTRGTDRRLGIRFEPETFEEQLLLEIFAQGAKDYRFKFSSWEQNHPGRTMREGLTSAWGEIVEPHASNIPDAPAATESDDGLIATEDTDDYQRARRSWLTGIADDLHRRGVDEAAVLTHIRLANQHSHPPGTDEELQDIVRKVTAAGNHGG